jgi:type IV fimbrial biogenesis protein FimT
MLLAREMRAKQGGGNMKSNHGFTIVELLVAVAILSILLGVAAPSLRELIMNATITGQANDLMSGLSVARSEAIKRGIRAGMCTSTNGTSCTNSQWHQGWIVFADADSDGDIDAGTSPLRVQPATTGNNTLTSLGHGTNGGGARFVVYNSAGTLTAALVGVTFTLCDSRTTATVGAQAADLKGRQMSISSTGRPRIQRFTCP